MLDIRPSLMNPSTNKPVDVPIGSVKEFFKACRTSVFPYVSLRSAGLTVFLLSESYIACKKNLII